MESKLISQMQIDCSPLDRPVKLEVNFESIMDDKGTVRKGSKFDFNYYIHLKYLGAANFVGYHMCKLQVLPLPVQAIISPLPDIHELSFPVFLFSDLGLNFRSSRGGYPHAR